MKQIYFIGSMGKGGAERVISLLANNQSRLGNDVIICTLLNNEVEYKLEQNIKVLYLNNGKSRKQNLLFWIRNIRNLVRNEKPDYVVSFIGRINILVLLSLIFLKKRIIISERNNPQKDGRSRFINLATRVLYPLAFKIVFQTDDVRKMFSKKIQKKSVVIANPIIKGLPTSQERNNKIVVVGRLEKQKNHILLIEAFSNVMKKFNDLTLHIYGDGTEFKHLSIYIDRHTLRNKIFLHGKQDDVHNQIKNAKLFIIPSRYEGLSNALMEAMYMGIPVIGSNVIGIKNLIEDGIDGLLFEDDDLEDLIEKITFSLLHYEQHLSMANNARIRMLEYNEDKIMKKWQDIFTRC